MSKVSLGEQIMLGTYCLDVPRGLDVSQRISIPGVRRQEVVGALDELIAKDFIEPNDLARLIDATGTSLELIPPKLTEKGKKEIAKSAKRSLGFFDGAIITINIGSGHTSQNVTKTTIHNETFEHAVIQQIDGSTAAPDAKQAAKSKLRQFLEDPLVNTILGAALGVILK